MSSTVDAGYYASQAIEIKKSKCKKSKNGKHVWLYYGNPPSTWGKCKHCDVTWYSK